MKIILLAGKAESGKTYTAEIMQKELSQSGLSVRIVPLALGLKLQARELGWNGNKDAKGRTFLQDLGKLMKTYHGKDYYAKKTIGKISTLSPFMDVIIVDDVRFPEEYKAFKGFNTSFVKIERPNHENKLSPKQRKDISETALDDFKGFDEIFTNSGKKDYDEIVKDYVKKSLLPSLKRKDY